MKFAMKLLLLVFITSCTSVNDTSNQKVVPSKISFYNTDLKNFKKAENSVALLIPLSGAHKDIGKNILDACVLGNQNSNMDIYVIDTNNYSDDLSQSSFKNLKATIGPVFFQETHKFASIFSDVPLFSLSNNITANNTHICACGLSPQEEIETIFKYLKENKLRSLTVLLPEGDFFKSIAVIIMKKAAENNMDEDHFNVVRYDQTANLSDLVQDINSQAIFSFEPIQVSKSNLFTLSSLALSNPEKWEGVKFAYVDNDYQREFMEQYRKLFRASPTVISLAAYDVLKMINESITSRKKIFDEEYFGTLGNFKIKKDFGIVRELEIFKIEKGEKIPA